jgi:hypothetical protein
MRRFTVLLTLVLVAAPSSTLLPQGAPVLAEGQRVRIKAPNVLNRRTQAIVAGWQGDTLLLRGVLDTGAVITRVPVGAIERLEVGRRRSRGAGAVRGLWIGFVSGALMGGTVGYVMGNDDGDFNRGQSAGILAAAMAGIGIIVGPVVGAASPGHQWTPVEVPARIGIVPIGPRSVGITVSMRPF